MARITVEDCVTVVTNRFELCLVASNRARSILSGADTKMDRKEKPAVIALREIADKVINVDVVKNNIMSAIKNRGIIENFADISHSALEAIEEETKNIALKDTAFAQENIEVED
jgi:DNA-directed RNA polymerase subunit omega